METFFAGANLRLARVFLGLTLEDLAERVGKSKQFIHKLEINVNKPNDELTLQLAEQLNVPPEFFSDNSFLPIEEEQFHFRKRMTTKVASKQKALAKGEVLKRLVDFCDKKLGLPDYSFLEYSVSNLEDIELAAESTRRHLGLGLGPIQDITRVVENAGVFVTTFKGISGEVDALSIVTNRPMIVRNENDVSACRLRFDIAHEIGHFVMHMGILTGDRATESEANRFGGSFLLPRSSFAKEFPISRKGYISWSDLSSLKMRWKTSKMAMLMRARQLSLIDDQQLKGGIIRLRSRGEAKVEEEDRFIEIEKPVLLDKSIKLINEHFNMSISDIAKDLNVGVSYLTEFISPETVLSLKKLGVIIPMRLVK